MKPLSLSILAAFALTAPLTDHAENRKLPVGRPLPSVTTPADSTLPAKPSTARLAGQPLFSQFPSLLTSGRIESAVKDAEYELGRLPVSTLTDVGTLTARPGSEPRYLAIGGALTAGFRNAGLYREAQLTSYPNLVARQMGLRKFQQPLFSPAQGNGTGYKRLAKSAPSPSFNDITNNLAVIGSDPMTLSPYEGTSDNLGFPFMGVHMAWQSEAWRIDPRVGPGVPYEPAFRSFFRRLLPGDDQQWLAQYLPFVKQQKADFCTIELGQDDVVWYATSGGYRLGSIMTQLAVGEGNPVIALLEHLKTNAVKGAIATVPDVLAFPYFKFYTPAAVRGRNGGGPLYAVIDDRYELVRGDVQYVAEIADTDILLPTSAVDNLAFSQDQRSKRGLSVNTPLSSRDVLSRHEIDLLRRVNEFNGLIRFQAAKHAVPVVDLQALYARILGGGYVTDDGVKVDPAYPGGNFFSHDGLYPSALGQAVIANEWIRVINQHYQTRIPLVNTVQFAVRFKD